MPTFHTREPGVAYTGTSLYLPKEGRNVRAIKNALEFLVNVNGEQDTLTLWKETRHHIVVPRSFLTDDQFATLRCPVVDLAPKEYPRILFHSKVVPDKLWPDKTIQRDALAAWEQHARGRGGILNLACISGETELRLHRAGKGFRMDAATAHDRFNDLGNRYRWDPRIPTFIRSNQGGLVGLQEVIGISFNGFRCTEEMRLENGMVLRVTDDHEILTPGGWVQRGVLGAGDYVMVEGSGSAVVPAKIVSMGGRRRERVFDVACRGPNHNYVAGGVVVHNCGKGKTVVALECISRLAMPALIIVGQSTIMNQWRDRIKELLGFDGGIGVIQGDPRGWDWERPITVAMLQTLARYADAISPAMRRHFGSIWWDEVHHLSAPTFCITSDMFPGQRYGLSATLGREDGLEPIYYYHIGRPFHTNLLQEIAPTVYFRRTPFTVDMHDPTVFAAVTDKTGNLNLSRLRTYMGTRPDRIAYQCRDIRRCLNAGRKILALSHSREQLELMHQIFGEEISGLCTGKQSVIKRWDALRHKQLIFGTHQLVLEAIDEKTLDFLIWLTPYGSSHPDGGVNALQQGMGRIQRHYEGKPTPKVLIYDDMHVRDFNRMCNRLRHQLLNWPAHKGGPYRPINLPLLEDFDV